MGLLAYYTYDGKYMATYLQYSIGHLDDAVSCPIAACILCTRHVNYNCTHFLSADRRRGRRLLFIDRHHNVYGLGARAGYPGRARVHGYHDFTALSAASSRSKRRPSMRPECELRRDPAAATDVSQNDIIFL